MIEGKKQMGLVLKKASRIAWKANRPRVAIVVWAGVLLVVDIAGADIAQVNTTAQIARLTGPGAVNDTAAVGIGGTDLGIMVNHHGQTFLLFGDTFSSDTSSPGTGWRWNTMAYTTDTDPADGITFDGWITSSPSWACEIIHSGRQTPVTEIPTGAISIGDRLYVWYMSVEAWGTVGGQWTCNYGGLAYSDDDGWSFTVVDSFEFPGDGNFVMVAAATRTDPYGGEDPYVYVWGTPAGRFGGVKLARILPQDIANLAAYQYMGGLVDGRPTWTTAEADGVIIVPAPVGEMSVMYNAAARVWTMLSFDENRDAIELWQARTPWGPWFGPITVTTGRTYPGLYGSYMNPLYVGNDGQSVYFTMSRWFSYDVYLMKTDFRLVAPADFDRDGDVDLADFANFQGAFNGPNRPCNGQPSCARVDFDGDGDVDLADFGTFQSCFNGPNRPPVYQ
ncbi:MAG: DUF4185 domain-containing protein [Phycisphaerae bacterium]|nr:DUF4185 domain-containing protein [Phycisphaerae bacterium]